MLKSLVKATLVNSLVAFVDKNCDLCYNILKACLDFIASVFEQDKGVAYMINFKKGCQVPYPEKIFEQYEKSEQWYIANISAEKILDAVKEFIARQNDLVFFFLEVPSKLDDETEIEPGVLDGSHKDVYYMDRMKVEEINNFLDRIK